ncbi:16S rRNA (uracil(1498)-N(3))-methyltransferase [Synechococcus sp. W60.2]|uniref:16S rRNA (uracil(1498)-N(3))-methyltransferase n=1 Tax=unclassified Synechococcus TaxID=2626047 RepID=UPI0039C2FB97
MVLSERTHDLSSLPRLAIDPAQRDAGGVLHLTGPQEHYLQRVRRLKPGDPFLVLDGSGKLWLAHWQPQGSQVMGEVEALPRELPVYLHLGLAVVKGPGFDEVFRQVTELGAARITPLLTERTVVEPGWGRRERWQKIVQEAAEQCERLRWPQVDPPTPWTSWLAELKADWWGIAVARENAPLLLQALPKLRLSERDPVLAVAIGPEGGWTEAERRQAEAHGGVPVSLGTTILRSTTAAVAASSQVAATYSCWGLAQAQLAPSAMGNAAADSR